MDVLDGTKKRTRQKRMRRHLPSAAQVYRFALFSGAGFLLARVELMETVNSFAYAWLTALFSAGTGILPSLIGIIVGKLSVMIAGGWEFADIFSETAVYLCASALLFSVKKLSHKENTFLFAAVGIAFYAASETALVLIKDKTVFNLLFVLLNTVAATASFLLFGNVLKNGISFATAGQQTVTAVFGALLVAGTGGLVILNVNIGAAISIMVLLFSGNVNGAGFASLFGILAGITFGLNSGGAAEYLLPFVLAGAISGMLRSTGRILSGTSALVIYSALFVIGKNGFEEIHTIIEFLTGTALFIVIPQELFGNLFDSAKNLGEDMSDGKSFAGRVQMMCEKKIESVCRSAEKLHRTVEDCLVDTEKCREADFEMLEARVAKTVCTHCKMGDTCAFANNGMGKRNPNCQVAQMLGSIRFVSNTWKGKMSMYRLVPETALSCIEDSLNTVRKSIGNSSGSDSILTAKAVAAGKSVSKLVSGAAVYKGEYGTEILIGLKTDGADTDEAQRITAAVEEALGEDLETASVSDGIITLVQRPKFELETGFTLASPDPDGICGDTCRVMPFGQSGYMAAVADGCGTGYSALRESSIAMELIESMAQSAFDDDKAVSLINLLMGLRTESDRYSTADLCIFNKYNGNTKFIKMGAVTSFILHGNDVTPVGCGASPLGTAENASGCVRNFKLRADDVIVMMTDGVFDSAEGYNDPDEYFIDLFKSMKMRDARSAAEEILNSAVRNVRRARDDMLVFVARVKKAG